MRRVPRQREDVREVLDDGIRFGERFDEVGLRVQRVQQQEGKTERAGRGERVRGEMDGGVFEGGRVRGRTDLDIARVQGGAQGMLFLLPAGCGLRSGVFGGREDFFTGVDFGP